MDFNEMYQYVDSFITYNNEKYNSGDDKEKEKTQEIDGADLGSLMASMR